MLNGSVVLLTGLGLVTAINFGYNIAVARFLGPTAYGHITAVYTLLMLISAVTLSFQIMTTKLVAQQESWQARTAIYRTLHRQAWACGLLVGMVVLLLRNLTTAYLNLPTPMLIVLLGVGVAFYVPLGAKRGYIQGACRFRPLALNMVLEGVVRLFGSLGAIALGWGTTGVIAANAGAIVIAYSLLGLPKLTGEVDTGLRVPVAFREGLQAAVFFAGQVVINNCDIVVVKHFFQPELAGLYAAVAMVGRVIFAFSWAVVSSMFPVAAGTHQRRRENDAILFTSLQLVTAIGLVFTLALCLAPLRVWTMLFGSGFAMAGANNFVHLLVLYAISTSIYACCVVLIAYEMSYKIANTGWVQLAFSALVIGGIYIFHSSLAQVIWLQIVMMLVLLITVVVPFLTSSSRLREESPGDAMTGELGIIRHASEEEVIAEFLKNDFAKPEFQEYQGVLQQIVDSPNLTNADENVLRRLLLCIRHGSLWRQLPKDTRWYEVRVRRTDLQRIRVFPRAQWRKLARRGFAATDIIQFLGAGDYDDLADHAFLAKLEDLRDLVRNDYDGGSVLLIGENAHGPFTILDGNHRVVAATLEAPEMVERYRFFCGLSPKMAQCCWYETNIVTLARYATNLLRYLAYDPRAELMGLLRTSAILREPGLAEPPR